MASAFLKEKKKVFNAVCVEQLSRLQLEATSAYSPAWSHLLSRVLRAATWASTPRALAATMRTPTLNGSVFSDLSHVMRTQGHQSYLAFQCSFQLQQEKIWSLIRCFTACTKLHLVYRHAPSGCSVPWFLLLWRCMYGGVDLECSPSLSDWCSLNMSPCTPTRDPWRALGSTACCILDSVTLRFVCVRVCIYDFSVLVN